MQIPSFGACINRSRYEALVGAVVADTKGQPDEYRIAGTELQHVLVTGDGGVGKTVVTRNLIREIYKNMRFRNKEGEPARSSVIAFSNHHDWEKLSDIAPGKYDLYDLEQGKLKMNVLEVPAGVNTSVWMNLVIEMLYSAYEMDNQQRQVLTEHLYQLYESVDAFQNPRNSKKVTLDDVYNSVYSVREQIKVAENPASGDSGGLATYDRLIDRLIYFHWGTAKTLCCYTGEDGFTVSDLPVKSGHVTVIESGHIDPVIRRFVSGMLSVGLYEYGRSQDGFDSRVMVVLDEADRIFPGGFWATKNKDHSTKWDQVFNEASGWNMSWFVIAQRPTSLPLSCITNTSITIAFRSSMPDDVDLMKRKLGLTALKDQKRIENWLQRQPRGYAVVRSTHTLSHDETMPCVVVTATG